MQYYEQCVQNFWQFQLEPCPQHAEWHVTSSLVGKARADLTGQCSGDWLNTMKPCCSKRSLWTGEIPGKPPVPQKPPATTSPIKRYCTKVTTQSSVWKGWDTDSRSLLSLLILIPGAVHRRAATSVWCLPDAAPLSGSCLHRARWVKCGQRLRPGGGGGVAKLWDQHSVCGGVAHPGVWLQPPAAAEHRPVSWRRYLCG